MLAVLLDSGLMSIETHLPKEEATINIKDLLMPAPHAEPAFEEPKRETNSADKPKDPTCTISATVAFERVCTTGLSNCDIFRANVPGGWLVVCEYQHQSGFYQGQILFYPDRSHEWNTA